VVIGLLSVASGIAAKHDDILPYLTGTDIQTEQNGQSTDGISGLAFGYEYLEKFIQLPFQVPESKEKDMRSLLMPSKEPTGGGSLETDGRTTSIDPWVENELFDGDSKLLEQISEMVIPALNNNPRRVKKFGNLYRLQAILASQESILQLEPAQGFDPRMSLEQLAKFVVIRIQWRQFASVIAARPNVLVELEEYALGETDFEELSTLAEQWANDRKLMNFLRFGVDSPKNSDLYCSYEKSERTIQSGNNVVPDPVRNAYSLQEVDLNNLIRVSPIIEEPEEGETQQRREFEDFESYINTLRETISAENEPFFCKPEDNATHLRVIQFCLDSPESSWDIDQITSQLGLRKSTVKNIISDLKSHQILEEDKEVNSNQYKINKNGKVTKMLTGISNDLSETGFRRRIRILAPMADLPNTPFPLDLFREELGASRNSMHYHSTELYGRGILEYKSLPGKVGAKYRSGVGLNTNNEIAQNLIEIVG